MKVNVVFAGLSYLCVYLCIMFVSVYVRVLVFIIQNLCAIVDPKAFEKGVGSTIAQVSWLGDYVLNVLHVYVYSHDACIDM